MRVSPHKASLFPQTKRILAIKYDNMTARDLSPPLFRERKRRKELISPDDGNYEESNLCPKIGKRVCGRSPSSAKRKEAVYDEERSNKCRRTDLRDVTLEFPATTLQVEVQLDPPLRGVQGHVLSKEPWGIQVIIIEESPHYPTVHCGDIFWALWRGRISDVAVPVVEVVHPS